MTFELAFQLLSPFPPGWGGVLLKGALSTITISLGAYLIGIAIGLCGAVLKLKGNRLIYAIIETYVIGTRAIPELILIVGFYFAGTEGLNTLLGKFGITGFEINGFIAAVLVLGLVKGAYTTEIFRGAIEAIPVGQIEAAKAFSINGFHRFHRIILPAMMPNALPGLANQWMSVTKNSALIAVVGYQELTLATRLAAGNTKHYFLFFLVASFLYLIITLLSNVLFKYLEKRFRYEYTTRGDI